MKPKNDYETRQREAARRAEERKPIRWWWMGQRDPVARVTAWLVVATCALVIVTIATVVVLIITDNTLNDTFIEANRAWIVPETPTFAKDVVKNEPVTVWLPYENIGHEPAMDTKVSIFFETIKNPPKDLRDLPRVGKRVCAEHPPDSVLGAVFAGKGDNGTLLLTSHDNIIWNDDLDADIEMLRVQGCYSYITFIQAHYSWYCFAFEAKLTAAPKRRVGAGCGVGAE